MASEITLSAALSITKSGTTISSSSNKTLDLSGDECLTQIVSIGFDADEQLELSGLDTVGQLLVENLDASNYVELSYGTGGGFAASVFAKLRPGCCCLLEPNSATIYAKAAVAACDIRFTATEV